MQRARLALQSSACYKGAAASFREYLKYVSDAELPSLESIFPKGKALGTECVAFHKALCHSMVEDGHKFIGIKVIPPSYEGIQCFREVTVQGNASGVSTSGAVCVPLFSSHTGRGAFDITKYRVQFVEGSLCIRLSESAQSMEPSALFRGACSCSVALEVVGTRFPFYPPCTSALACDLGGIIGFFKGPDCPVQNMGDENLLNHHFVMTYNGEPVQVGCGKLCLGGSPFQALKEAIRYSKLLELPLEKDHVVLCSGACPRFPAQRGNYLLNWGVFGSTTCSLK